MPAPRRLPRSRSSDTQNRCLIPVSGYDEWQETPGNLNLSARMAVRAILVFKLNNLDRNVGKRASLACYKSVIPVKYHIKCIVCLLNLYRREFILLLHQIDKTFYFFLLQK